MTEQQDNQNIESTVRVEQELPEYIPPTSEDSESSAQEPSVVPLNQFVEHQREDGTIEMRHPNYDELMARVEEPNDEPLVISDEEIALAELNTIRKMRNAKLKETDWWAVGDRTMTQEQIDYRQALRDITEVYSSREDVVWPEIPEV